MDENLDINDQVRNMARAELAKREIARRLQEAPGEPAQEESFVGKLPRNIAIGLTHAGRNIHNVPHDLARALENATKDIGNAALIRVPGVPSFQPKQPLSSMLPYDTESYADVFGQKGPGTFSDRLIQKTVEHSPEIIALGQALRKASPYLFRSAAAKPYTQAAELLQKEGIEYIEPPKELIEDARQFLKSTKANRDLIARAETGHIPSLHKLQSDLGRVSAGYARNPFSFAERDFGRAGFQTREALLQHQQNELRRLGAEEAADLYQKGLDQYRTYHKLKHPVRATAALALSQTPIPGYIKYLGKFLGGSD